VKIFVQLIILKLCCYALPVSAHSADWLDTCVLCIFSGTVDTCFAGSCNYCDIAAVNQGREDRLMSGK
jgi:hypothetical protein